MPPENTPSVPDTEEGDTTDADAEAFADEWMAYKAKVDKHHSFFEMFMESEPEKPHFYFRRLFGKKSK